MVKNGNSINKQQLSVIEITILFDTNTVKTFNPDLTIFQPVKLSKNLMRWLSHIKVWIIVSN